MEITLLYTIPLLRNYYFFQYLPHTDNAEHHIILRDTAGGRRSKNGKEI